MLWRASVPPVLFFVCLAWSCVLRSWFCVLTFLFTTDQNALFWTIVTSRRALLLCTIHLIVAATWLNFWICPKFTLFRGARLPIPWLSFGATRNSLSWGTDVNHTPVPSRAYTAAVRVRRISCLPTPVRCVCSCIGPTCLAIHSHSAHSTT